MGNKLSVRTVTGFGGQLEVRGLLNGEQVIGFERPTPRRARYWIAR